MRWRCTCRGKAQDGLGGAAGSGFPAASPGSVPSFLCLCTGPESHPASEAEEAPPVSEPALLDRTAHKDAASGIS